MTTAEALAILGLSERVTRSEVRRAYRNLVKVWHPDRFAADARLQDEAHARLASINSAYEFLSSEWKRPAPRRSSSRQSRSENSSAAGLRLALYGVALIVATVIAMALGIDVGTRFGSHAALNTTGDARDRVAAQAPAPKAEVPSGPLPSRPENGAILHAPKSRGLGVLQISNGMNMDAAVILVPLAGEIDVHAIYVRAGEHGRLSEIAPRAYRLRFMLGHTWRGEDFGVDTDFKELANLVTFRELDSETGQEFEEMSLTLNAVEDSNARTKRVAPFRLLLP